MLPSEISNMSSGMLFGPHKYINAVSLNNEIKWTHVNP